MSMHSTNVLQTLIQYFGALLLKSNQSNSQPSNDLLLDLSSANSNSAGVPQYAASDYLFKKLLEVKGLSWGCALTHVCSPLLY